MTRALIAADSSGACPFSFSAPLRRTRRLSLAGGQRLRWELSREARPPERRNVLVLDVLVQTVLLTETARTPSGV